MICSFAYGSIVLSYRRCSSSGSPILEVVYVYGVNFVKSLFKGQHKRLDDVNPIRDLNDSRISWMVSFVNLLMYFESINRGGLTYPSNFLFNVIQCAYNVFNVCISKYEKEFLKVVNQKQTLL